MNNPFPNLSESVRANFKVPVSFRAAGGYRPGLLLVLALSSTLVVAEVAGVPGFSPRLLRYVSEKWGSEAAARLQEWRETGIKCVRARANPPFADVPPRSDLQIFNTFLNKIRYTRDIEHWGVEDYWATPVEMLTSNGADCEDYSIAKYFSLKELGIPVEHLRITYVHAVDLNEAHMVLAYYPDPDADPYILDNLTGQLVPASERPDLVPVYSFNDEDLWAAGDSSFKGKSSQIRLWRELLEKIDQERNM